MAISLKTAGTWATLFNTSTNSPALVGTPAAGDRTFVFWAWRDYSTTISPPAGWTEITEFADGTVTSGSGLGSVKVSAAYRDWVSGDGNPTFTFSANVTVATRTVMLWTKGAGDTWDTPTFVTGAWPATSTTQTLNASSTTTVPSGAVVMCLLGLRNDEATFTRATDAIKDSGAAITWNGNYVESPSAHSTSTSGDDIAADLGHRFVTTGASGVTLQTSATLSTAETGSALWVIQPLVSAPTGPPSGAFFRMF